MTFDALPLRAQKRARTRKALLEALITRLAVDTLDDIQVSDLARDAGISQATFFNYFPSKTDLLTWFIRMWSLRVSQVARDARDTHDSALGALEAVFADTAAGVSGGPQVMLELIAHQARMPVDLVLEPVPLEDRLLLLDDDADAATLDDGGLSEIIPRQLAAAVQAGELPPDTNIDLLTVAVVSVFFGVPLAVGRRQPDAIAPLYQNSLALLWAGARQEVS